MSLDVQVKNLALGIATKVKALNTAVGTIGGLNTTVKTDLVSAINEVAGRITNFISDTAQSNSTTYSSNKIVALINAATAQVKTDIVGGAAAAFDTLVEIQALLQNEDSQISGLLSSVTNRLRLDTNGSYTSTQQAQGRLNLDVYSTASIGPVDTDYVAIFNAGLA